MFAIFIHELAERELAELRRFERARILEQIETKLRHQPTQTSRNQKQLRAVIPSFEAVPPVWELRIGDYRVFYDVDVEAQTVHVRAIRYKGTQGTEDIV
jgi:mRNA-degrading endonuclease RelE of RelBE toxin-antitoxin system